MTYFKANDQFEITISVKTSASLMCYVVIFVLCVLVNEAESHHVPHTHLREILTLLNILQSD